MSELEQYTKIIMNVLSGLNNECLKYEHCTIKCPFYNKNEGICYLKARPADYNLSEIEQAVSQIIDNEIKNDL